MAHSGHDESAHPQRTRTCISAASRRRASASPETEQAQTRMWGEKKREIFPCVAAWRLAPNCCFSFPPSPSGVLFSWRQRQSPGEKGERSLCQGTFHENTTLLTRATMWIAPDLMAIQTQDLEV
jgi:hypothetical protein